MKRVYLQERAKSKSQQKLMGMVHAMDKGEMRPEDTDDPEKFRKLQKSLTQDEANDFAETKHKGLPEKVKKEMVENLVNNLFENYTDTFNETLVQNQNRRR